MTTPNDESLDPQRLLIPRLTMIAIFRHLVGHVSSLIRILPTRPKSEDPSRCVGGLIEIAHAVQMVRAHPLAPQVMLGLLWAVNRTGSAVVRCGTLFRTACEVKPEDLRPCLLAMQERGFVILLGEDRGEPVVAMLFDWMELYGSENSADEEDLE